MSTSKDISKLASTLKIALEIEDGEVYSFTSTARGGRPAEVHNVIVVSLQSKDRWRCYESGGSKGNPEGKWTVPSRMLQKATKRYTEPQKADLYAAGKKAWGELDAKRQVYKEKRKEVSQTRYDKDWVSKLDRTTMYGWSGGTFGVVQGNWTGEIKDGKAKMMPSDPYGFKRNVRAVWVLLDRILVRSSSSSSMWVPIVSTWF